MNKTLTIPRRGIRRAAAILLTAASLAVGFAAIDARAQSPTISVQPAVIAPERFDGLEGLMETGVDGPFTKMFDGKRFVLSNETSADEYYFIHYPYADGTGDVRAVVEVSLDQATQTGGGAGLMFAVDEEKDSFLIAAILADGNVVVSSKEGGEHNVLYKKNLGNVVKPSFNEIEVIRIDGETMISVNGTHIATLHGEALDRGTSGGIIGIGTGTFVFSGYKTYYR